MSKGFLGLIAAAGLLLVAGCVRGGSASLPPDASGVEAGAVFGACSAPVDLVAEPVGYLASADRWIRVDEVVAPVRDETSADLSTIRGGDSAGAVPTEMTVNVPPSYWPGVEWALNAGGEVWFAMADPTLYERDFVAYVVAFTPAGEAFFPGDCQEQILGEPLRERFGSGFDRVMHDIVGLSGPALATQLGIREDNAGETRRATEPGPIGG